MNLIVTVVILTCTLTHSTMKKALLLSAGSLLISLSFLAQSLSQSPSFMSNIYYADYIVTQDSAYRLSYGLTTKIKEGYVSFGYNHHISNSINSFFCNKNFAITGYGNSFLWKGFEMFDAVNCSGQLTKVIDCSGITAVEVNGNNNQRYLVAGAYSKGVFLTAIDSVGNVLYSTLYPFPHLTNTGMPLPSKAIIINSETPNQYFICGSFESNMYLLKVSMNGSIIWSKYYSSGSGIQPKDLLINPYQPNTLNIVGSIQDLSNDKNACFMTLSTQNGAVINTKLFGFSNNEDEFRSIIAGAYINSNNANGFVLSGYTQNSSASVGQGNAWVIKLDVNGNIIWNRLLNPSLGTNTGCVDVTQRLNTFGNYEYYALIASSMGMQVAKLEDDGMPFQYYNPNGLENEFTYTRIQSTCVPVNIDYVNTTSSWNLTGIQVYGTLFSYNGYSYMNGSYCVGAYFNGKTNCAGTYTRVLTVQEGPPLITLTDVSSFGSFDQCSNFLVTDSYAGIISAYQCGNLIPSGSNLRTASNGEPLVLVEEEEAAVGIYPNPVRSVTHVNYKVEENTRVTIELLDVSGRQILLKSNEISEAGRYQEEIDFEKLQLKKGIYFARVSVNGKSDIEKIIYTD